MSPGLHFCPGRGEVVKSCGASGMVSLPENLFLGDFMEEEIPHSRQTLGFLLCYWLLRLDPQSLIATLVEWSASVCRWVEVGAWANHRLAQPNGGGHDAQAGEQPCAATPGKEPEREGFCSLNPLCSGSAKVRTCCL